MTRKISVPAILIVTLCACVVGAWAQQPGGQIRSSTDDGQPRGLFAGFLRERNQPAAQSTATSTADGDSGRRPGGLLSRLTSPPPTGESGGGGRLVSAVRDVESQPLEGRALRQPEAANVPPGEEQPVQPATVGPAPAAAADAYGQNSLIRLAIRPGSEYEIPTSRPQPTPPPYRPAAQWGSPAASHPPAQQHAAAQPSPNQPAASSPARPSIIRVAEPHVPPPEVVSLLVRQSPETTPTSQFVDNQPVEATEDELTADSSPAPQHIESQPRLEQPAPPTPPAPELGFAENEPSTIDPPEQAKSPSNVESETHQPAPEAQVAAPREQPQPPIEPTPHVEPQPVVQLQPRGNERPALTAAPEPTLIPAPESQPRPIQPAVPPQLKVTITGPSRMDVGQAQPCAAIVSNVGNVDAHDVSVLVLLNGERAQSLDIGTLNAGQTRRLPFDILPQQPGLLGVNAIATSRSGVLAVASGNVQVIEHDVQMQLAGPRQLKYGEKVEYALAIRNSGSLPAENLVVNVQLGSSNLEGLFKGTLAPGDQKVVRFQIVPRQAGFQSLRASAFCDGVQRARSVAELRVQHGQLDITANGPSMKLVGAEAVYTVHVKNIGDAPAHNVLMTAHLPAGVKFRHGVEKISFYDGVTWRVGLLEPGQRQTFELRCELLEAGKRTIQFVAQGDQGLKASQEMALNVAAPSDVQLHVTNPAEPVNVGELANYSIEVHNPSALDAHDVELTMQLGPSLKVVEIDGLPAQITPRGVVFQTIPLVAAQQTRRISVKVQAVDEGAHALRVELTAANPKSFVAAEVETAFLHRAVTRGEGAALRQEKENQPGWRTRR